MKDTEKKITEIKINRGGPIKVNGSFAITGTDGSDLKLQNPNGVYLCACGRSKNKPYCDGSHNQ